MVIKMNVPKLRFKEFTNDWKEYILNNQSDVRDGTHDSPKYIDYGFPLITSKNLKDNGTLDLENVNYLNKEDFDKINLRSKVDIGDILFGMIGTIGKPVRVNRNDFAIKNVALIKEKGLIKNDYLIHYLQTTSIKKQFANNMDGGTQKFIALEKIRKLKISQPNRDEQLKLVNMFNLLDKKIELQSQKIEALKLYKKGLIEKIYLMDIYDKITLKNLFNSYGGTSLESYVSDKGTYNFISIGNYSMDGEYINNNQKIVLNDKTKDKLLNKNDLVMILNDKTSSGDIIGSTILIDKDNKYIYNQRSQRLVCKKEILPEYAWCYLNTSKHRRKVFSHSQGGTQIYINFSQIEKMKVLLPKDFKNQKIISTIIIDTCNKIKLNEIKMKELRKLKKGLMQNMFV